MDPNAALRTILAAMAARTTPTDEQLDVLEGLIAWLRGGGFAPDADLQTTFCQKAGESLFGLPALRRLREGWECEQADAAHRALAAGEDAP